MTTRPLFPPTVDSTIIAAFRSCPHKMFRMYVQHWKPKGESVHLVAGGAFAAGCEAARRAFYEGGVHRDDAVVVGVNKLLEHYGDFDCPSDSAKSRVRMAGALEFYFENYPLGEDGTNPVKLPDGKLGIELSFSLPLQIKHPQSGNPILYTGRMDYLADFAGGVYIIDEKTTSSLGASWSRQWALRSQFTGYCYAARELGIPASGVIVRGVSILKTKYDTQQAITYRTEYDIARWYAQLHHDVQRMIDCWDEGYWDFNLDTACTEYGGCGLTQVCESMDPERWLGTYFEPRVWDPLGRKQISVAEWEAMWGHTS